MGDMPSEAAEQASEQRHQKLMDVLSTVEEFGSEKRTAKREQMLKGWFRALSQYATSPEPIWDQREELLKHCRFSVRQGSPSEQYAACRVLEAMAILIGNEASYYEDIQGHLTRVITSAHRATPVRSAALRALGMAVFLGVDDDQVTESVLDLCESLAQPTFKGNTVPHGLRANALTVWTVLATTIHDLYVAGKDDASTGRGLLLLPLLLECLEQSEDPSLRDAAGECVTYIHAARLELGASQLADEGAPDAQNLNTTQRQYQQGSWEGSEWEDTMAEIEQVISDLSNQSGHYMSKKAKKEQRANFREYLATIQDNENPEHTVQFRGGSLELGTWKDIVCLNYIRRCLQGGFQIQLLTNPVLQQIFGATGHVLNANGGMSQLEKRLYMSKTSEAAKLKDMDRTKKRDKRNNVKNHFLTADGEDI
eukprot:Nitzschia sp. Nitz4//scaffold49_size126201//76414//77685//NITZ4_003648-RA/size126201-processed-gene-0.145-mRNA-1//1//CDS//3329553167//8988//frame0